MDAEIDDFKEGNLRTDISKKNDSESSLAQSLLQKQIENAGMRHPNFQSSKSALNPDRPLTDIPEPMPRYQQPLDELLAVSAEDMTEAESLEDASMWALIASPELASHLELLQLGGLIDLPQDFFEPKDNSKSELISPLTEMTLLDMADIYQIWAKYPKLTRYGFKPSDEIQTSVTQSGVGNDAVEGQDSINTAVDMPEMINDLFAPSW